MAYTEEMAGMEAHEAKNSAKNASGWGILGTLLGAAGTATGITALATKVPKNGGCGCNGNTWNNGGCNDAPSAFMAWGKSCDDAIALTRAIYDGRIVAMNERFEDRQVINQEMFGLYKSQTDADFGLYKNQRDQFDVLQAQISDLKAHVAVTDAVRPYQDALIQCDINNVAKDAEFNLFRRTCRMISGEVVLPNTPVVTGYASYFPPCCGAAHSGSAPAVAAPAPSK